MKPSLHLIHINILLAVAIARKRTLVAYSKEFWVKPIKPTFPLQGLTVIKALCG
jgi:hypothetical protein